MAQISNVDRFNQTTEDKYVFKAPTGEKLTYLGISNATEPVTGDPLYSFIYVTYPDGIPTAGILDVNKDLVVVQEDGVVVPNWDTAPTYVTYDFKVAEFSVAVSLNNEEAFFEYAPPVHLSECQSLGLITQENYKSIDQIFKERLVGAINVRVVRDQNGLVSVTACVVNKGQIPDFP